MVLGESHEHVEHAEDAVVRDGLQQEERSDRFGCELVDRDPSGDDGAKEEARLG